MCWRRSSRRLASRWRRAAVPADERRPMATEMKSVIRTENAPAPFQGAPYSQAIRTGEFVFVSGQLGLKPGQTEIGGSIEEQTEQIFANLAAILAEAGTGLERLVKTTRFLPHPPRFARVKQGYARPGGGSPPPPAPPAM